MQKKKVESAVASDSTISTADTAPKGSLFRRYAAYMAGLLSLSLLVSGSISIIFSYQDTRALVDELQREKARAVASRIAQVVQAIELQMRGATLFGHTRTTANGDPHYVELLKLLRLTPAVSDAAWVDASGHERIRVSRLDRDVIDSAVDWSKHPGFLATQAGKSWYGGVDFRRQSEPHLAVAVPGNRREDGIVFATINLKFVSDAIMAIRIGRSGHAYVVDAEGRLISHPDSRQVLRMTSLSELPQVRAALASRSAPDHAQSTIIATSETGQRTLTTSAPIEALGWHVLVEQPVSEAFAPLYGSLVRAALLLLAGIAVAIAASLVLARRMTAPIRTLGAGAKRIGEGHLDEHVVVRTGDELQALADQFNQMAGKLRESYSGLERKIDERTRQLEEANRDKARFLAAASHDLRQPVHALGLFVAQLRETRDGKDRERLIDKVAASSTAVSDLIEALLDISKLDAGIVAIQSGEFALQPLLDRVEQACAPAARDKGLRLRIRPTPLHVNTDPVLLERILLNLSANAIRYTRQGGAIVTARLRGRCVRIEVWDTGIGIAADQQRRIFEEFYQVEGTPDGGSRGLGLGLAIVDRLARLLGLQVRVRSVQGHGSVFAIDVQRADAVIRLPVDPAGQTAIMRFDAMPVLLIDDDPIARDATAGLLAQWGCQVFSAASGADAMYHLRDRWMPRLIICDYRLGANELGTALVRKVRTHVAREIPAVIISADAGTMLRDEAAATGAYLLHKPLNPARLRAFLLHVASGPAAPPADRAGSAPKTQQPIEHP